jgi:Ca-activated chloride channel family protein
MDLSQFGLPAGARFANPEFLLLLPVLLLLIGLHFYRQSSSQAAVKFGAFSMLARTKPTMAVRLLFLLPLLLWLTTLSITLALARPQIVKYETLEEILDYGADIMLAIDVSESMSAMDFQPDNRLEVSKAVVQEFIQNRKGDHIGVVGFAGSAVTICPLTSNLNYLHEKIDELGFGLLDDGTAIGTAISTALNRLAGSKAKSKVIILLTDGMNNRGEVLPLDAAQIAAKRNVKIYTISVGTDGEVPFPNRAPYYGRKMRVGVDDDLLQKIAEITGAVYRKATDPEKLLEVYKEINELEKTEIKSRVFSYPVATEYFHFFLFAAVGLFLLYLLLSITRLNVLP